VRVEARKLSITREDVLAGLMDAVNMAATSAELTGAWREIGKVIGAYAPTEVKVSKRISVVREQVAQMTDEELAKLGAIEGEYEVLDFEEAEADARS
jgi:hypothetical protein